MKAPPRQPLRQEAVIPLVLKITTVLGVAYIVALAFLFVQQRSYVFPIPADAKAAQALGAGTVTLIETSDGEQLYAEYFPAEGGKATVLIFHGNGSQVAWERPRAAKFVSAGYSALLVEYRGYPGSTGAPSEAGLRMDGLAAYDWLAGQGVSDLFINAHSLGTGVALYVASKRPVKAIALEAAYPSLVDVARDDYPIFPVGLLMRDKFPAEQWAREVTAPLLVIHGDKDKVIPVKFGAALYEKANEPKSFVTLDGAGHNNLGQFGATEVVIQYFDEISRASS